MVSNTPISEPPRTPAEGEGDAGTQRLLAIAVGNTRARWAVFAGRELTPGGVCAHHTPHDTPHDTHNAVVGALRTAAEEVRPDLIALASVADGPAAAIERALAGVGVPIVRLGRELQPPLTHTLEDASTLGIDRALNAFAAFSLLESAVAIVDAGSAITVDFVDGEGVFHGGVIAPGCSMMLKALHTGTEALPALAFDPHAGDTYAGDPHEKDPREGEGVRKVPFGRDTPHAMQLGVTAAARGLVREVVERFAEFYEAFPRVIGTGGDAGALFEEEGVVERVIPDLQLIGIQRTIEAAMLDGEG